MIKVIQTKTEDKYGQQETGNYVLTEITLKNTASKQVNAFKKELENMYGDLGMSTNVNEYIRSQKKGMLSDDEMDEIVEEFLKEMNAKKVSEGEVNGAKCIYGYSKSVDSYVFENEDKVNVNIAFSYNEEEDVTYIHRAVPFIDKSF